MHRNYRARRQAGGGPVKRGRRCRQQREGRRPARACFPDAAQSHRGGRFDLSGTSQGACAQRRYRIIRCLLAARCRARKVAAPEVAWPKFDKELVKTEFFEFLDVALQSIPPPR